MKRVPPSYNLLKGSTLDEKIINLWKGNPENFGEYSGLRTFNSSLQEYGVHKDIHYLQELFQNEVPSYTMSIRLAKKFPRREYLATEGFGQAVQSDLAFMNPFNKRIGFIVVVDVFSRKIFAAVISNKTSNHIEKKLEHIFNVELKSYPTTFSTDAGGIEHMPCHQKYYKSLILSFFSHRRVHRIKRLFC